MTIAVVGAGWAGLAAALTLHRQGHAIHLFESAHQAGGRARSVRLASGQTLDNGQHLLLGAYTETLALMRSLGCEPDRLLQRLPLTLESADARWAMRAPAWPAPLHTVGALLAARGPTLGERLLAGLPLLMPARGARQPAREPDDTRREAPSATSRNDEAGETVAQWLARCRQSPSMVRHVWEPLCLAALNTPMDQACAQLFQRVLRDALLGPAHHSQMLVPRCELSSLWPNAAVRELNTGPANTVRFGHTVRTLAYETGTLPLPGTARKNTRVVLNGEPFDAVILATAPPSAARLLAGLGTAASAGAHTSDHPGLEHDNDRAPHRALWLENLNTFRFLPIATVTLMLEHPWHDPAPMLMLQDNPAQGHHGQWLFNHNHLNPLWKDRITVVISDARAFTQVPESSAVQGVVEQVRTQTAARRHPFPGVRSYTVITEKRATFAAVPGQWRPGNTTPWPGVFVAGDWTDTGYPAVLEGAVRSGQQAARQVLSQ
jgi:squalene-associated FAD-dependent desaturase